MAPSFFIDYSRIKVPDSLVRCPCAFQDERRGFGSSKSLVLLLPRRALFLSYVTSIVTGGASGAF